MQRAEVTKTTFTNYFHLASDEPITEQIAAQAQAKAGYPPEGYGFYAFKTWEEGGLHRARWVCGSCE